MNKSIILLLFNLFLITFSLYAQVLPMLGEKTAWRYGMTYYQNLNDTHGTYMNETYFELMEGDSIVDGVTYRRLAITNISVGANAYHWDDVGNSTYADQNSIYEEWEQWNPDDNYSIVLLRENNGKIYIQRQSYNEYLQKDFVGIDSIYSDSGEGTDQVLYDFTLNIGDIYPMIGNVTVELVEQVITSDGLSRKLFTLSNGMQILEGMGCVDCYGMFIGYQSADVVYSPYGTWYFSGHPICCYKNGVDDNSSFIPFNWTPTKMIDNKFMQKKLQYSDLLGRHQKTSPIRGIYILNRKKYVVK